MAASVLFISSGNGVRSQMAEAFVRHLAGSSLDAYSAGSRAEGVHPLAVTVMAERGIDISAQRAKGLQEYIGSARFDYLITVCDRNEPGCPVFPGRGNREYWPFADPDRAAGDDDERLARFRAVRDQVEERVRLWLATRPHRPGTGRKHQRTRAS
jgi:arsenate reductase (thioredoxin)